MPIYSSTYKSYLLSKRKSEEDLRKLNKDYQKKNNKKVQNISHKLYRGKH